MDREDFREWNDEQRERAEERRDEFREEAEERAEERRERAEERRERAEEWRDDVLGDRGRRDFYDGRGRQFYDDDDWQWRTRQVRNFWRSWDRNQLPFRYGWWDNYGPDRWPIISPWRYTTYQNRPYYWWSSTPAPRLTTWLVYNWNRPYYWDYGPGRNIYCRDDYVYYDGEPVMRIENYYWNVHNLAREVPVVDERQAEAMEWTPLGVFALIREDESQSRRALQIAVNRDGLLSGTYYNQENGHVHPITGRVDERTQRAAWKFADGEHEDVVFETSIYNLTESDTTMMVHFGPDAGEPQVWRLVRLEQPSTGTAGPRPYDLP